MSLSASAAAPPVGAFSTTAALCSSLPVGWGTAWGCHRQLHSADGLKTNTLRSGVWRSLGKFFGVFYGFLFLFSKIPPEFLLNLFLLLFRIYKPRWISSHETPLPTLCLSSLYFRGPVWVDVSCHHLFSHHIHGNRPQKEQSAAVSCSRKDSQGSPAHRVRVVTAASTACSSREFGALRCTPPASPA